MTTNLAIIDSRGDVVGLTDNYLAAYRRIARATQWPGNPTPLTYAEVRTWLQTHGEIAVVIGLTDDTADVITETYRVVDRSEVSRVVNP